MRTEPWAMIAVLLSTFITSSAQILWKSGAERLSFDVFELITNYNLIIGCVMYALAAGILIVSLKYGELSVLYPIYATSFVWVALLSMFFLSELMNFWKWFGVIGILLGVSFIGLGSHDKKEVAAGVL